MALESVDVDIKEVKGVGEKMALRLAKLHLYRLNDILFHLPLRYLDHTRVYPLGDISVGQHVQVEGIIEKKSILSKPKRSLLVKLKDASGQLSLRFFHFHTKQAQTLEIGGKLRVQGEVRRGRYGWEMIHPEYQRLDGQVSPPVNEYLTPIYPTTEGLGQATLRKLAATALKALADASEELELLPGPILEKLKFPTIKKSLALLHLPPPEMSIGTLEQNEHPAKRRLAFEELLAHHLALRQKKKLAKKKAATPLQVNAQALETFIHQFPFQLTAAQHRAIEQIKTDLSSGLPMMRLVQGDVGSGKTVVAAVAAWLALSNGYQVAFMAPTEILARQHFQNFSQWFAATPYQVTLLKSQMNASEKKKIKAELSAHDVHLAIGTHALFQKDVAFLNLGLVIVDEQHRFGVEQRLALQNKGQVGTSLAHQLVMTATPIPRTLAMTLYADLDYTVIDELPPGRKKIATVAIAAHRRAEVIERCLAQCHAGRQVYWVCTLIEANEQLNAQAAEDVKKDLASQMPGLRIGLVHGRMKPDEKEQVMQQFKQGALHLLVATTVIEVGVDVPNASLMIIENPERLGLSQLHQLRGRVGRGTLDSFCILLYQDPLSLTAKSRLEIMRQSQDGFWIAEQDLALRGFGELLGTRQSGVVQFKIANWRMIPGLLATLEEVASCLETEHAEIIPKLIARWLPTGMECLSA